MEKQCRQRCGKIHLQGTDGYKIVGDCLINNNSYLIIEVENSSELSIASTPFAVTSELPNIQLTHFEIDGQMLAIAETESSVHPASEITALLTERELQITTLVALGKGNKQIASQLCISEWTVSTHLRRIFIKLGVDSRAAMVYRCANLLPQI
jgi:DNA-binding CsgD family transcriptional regulator